jgi:uncharacterized membrane protein YedE/YeeE
VTDDSRSRSIEWRRYAVALAAGAVFSLGLCLSGMTQPAKVLGFLDFLGAWDPSLAFVMVGAIGVASLAFRWSAGRTRPVLDSTYRLAPARAPVSVRVVAGAAIFGVGWGLGGLCPGPAVTSLVSGNVGPVVFVAAMLGGMALTARVSATRPTGSSSDTEGEATAPATSTH